MWTICGLGRGVRWYSFLFPPTTVTRRSTTILTTAHEVITKINALCNTGQFLTLALSVFPFTANDVVWGGLKFIYGFSARSVDVRRNIRKSCFQLFHDLCLKIFIDILPERGNTKNYFFRALLVTAESSRKQSTKINLYGYFIREKRGL